MTIHIPAANGLVVALSIVIGCIVFHRSRRTHDGRRTRGDLAVAITAAGAAVLILGFLFGLGGGGSATGEAPAPTQTPAAPSTPPPSASEAAR